MDQPLCLGKYIRIRWWSISSYSNHQWSRRHSSHIIYDATFQFWPARFMSYILSIVPNLLKLRQQLLIAVDYLIIVLALACYLFWQWAMMHPQMIMIGRDLRSCRESRPEGSSKMNLELSVRSYGGVGFYLELGTEITTQLSFDCCHNGYNQLNEWKPADCIREWLGPL